MKTTEIHISGRVQGVGFRPFIFNLAEEFQLKGYVSNDELGVIIVCQGENSEQFFNEIHHRKPKSSEIIFSEIKEIETAEIFDNFYIKPTEKNIVVDIPLTPDFATCESCETELFDEKNPRYFYPFTTCTQCGPRYSVTKKFPFERENTAIEVFKMCPNCLAEYQNPEDVRFHSQTNSCPNCGIQIWLKDNQGNEFKGSNKEIFEKLAKELSQGKIVALKNTAGYLLMCDATNSEAILELRKRKRRPTKPFAVLFSGISTMKEYLEISELQIQHFKSSESPIIVTKIKDKKDLAIEEISPNMNTIGAMFPYSGTLKLISKTFGKPLIATSGNFHGSPICSTTEEAEQILGKIADYFLHNTLEIQHPQDDSVIKFSPKHHQKIVFRRSRGFAPNYFFAEELSELNKEKNKILSLGGDLKNTFAIVPNNHVYISEYIGDLANFETYERFENTVKSYQKIFNFQPEIILKDLHPKYENQNIISKFSKKSAQSARIEEIQHHKAHFASILGEKKLWKKDKILGIIWDGIGFGTSTEIWGGEFFLFENQKMERVAQLENFAWILSDKMSKTPKISALSISGNNEDLKFAFDENEWKIYTNLIEKSEIKTSSMGRFFDAVAFVLGYEKPLFFEGESAMWLEKISQDAFDENVKLIDYLEEENFENIPTKKLFSRILKEKISGKNLGEIGLNFHYTLIKAIEKIAEGFAVKEIAFSGGVWQNALLVDLVIEFLGDKFELHFHEKLSPNDENISFGQLNYYLKLK
ncbi:carbamoyltransferase HypF [Cloacibacterium normanense]|uniref:Carbamoyltransferase n=1 Tax=Cloacibacterium normanense TaxID=237258 RepID=A0A2S7I3S1_9FLAO|nr:carbamoyltransferase HypF [Cloacibacterium normanense]PPZ91246.1 carbamoyltransferase HypF [Cloacibacterium normanense]